MRIDSNRRPTPASPTATWEEVQYHFDKNQLHNHDHRLPPASPLLKFGARVMLMLSQGTQSYKDQLEQKRQAEAATESEIESILVQLLPYSRTGSNRFTTPNVSVALHASTEVMTIDDRQSDTLYYLRRLRPYIMGIDSSFNAAYTMHMIEPSQPAVSLQSLPPQQAIHHYQQIAEGLQTVQPRLEPYQPLAK